MIEIQQHCLCISAYLNGFWPRHSHCLLSLCYHLMIRVIISLSHEVYTYEHQCQKGIFHFLCKPKEGNLGAFYCTAQTVNVIFHISILSSIWPKKIMFGCQSFISLFQGACKRASLQKMLQILQRWYIQTKSQIFHSKLEIFFSHLM